MPTSRWARDARHRPLQQVFADAGAGPRRPDRRVRAGSGCVLTATVERPITSAAAAGEPRKVWLTGDVDLGGWSEPVEFTVRADRVTADGREVEVCANYYHPDARTRDTQTKKGPGHFADWEWVPLDPQPGACEFDNVLAAFTTREKAVVDLIARALLRAELDLQCAIEKIQPARELAIKAGIDEIALEAGTAFARLSVCLLPVTRALTRLGAARWPRYS